VDEAIAKTEAVMDSRPSGVQMPMKYNRGHLEQ
jgi:hypothetical protein